MPGVETYGGDLKINLLKRNALPQLLSFYPDNIFQCNGPKQLKLTGVLTPDPIWEA